MKLVQRVDFIKAICTGNKVLHLGCTNWPYTEDSIASGMLLHYDLEKIASILYGFDYDQEGIDILHAAGVKNLFHVDLEYLDEVPLEQTFDVIVAGEMIEHLSNPGLFLKGIQRFMDSNTRLIITTVNAYAAFRFVNYGLRGHGGINEPVHPDHIAYYSYRTLKLTLERTGFEIEDFCFYDIGSEHRPFNPWYYNLVNDIAVRFSPQLSDGVIAVCRLKGERAAKHSVRFADKEAEGDNMAFGKDGKPSDSR